MNERELRMAVECQLLCSGNREGLFAGALKKFADLIRADERKACAKVAQETICDTHIPTGINIYGTCAAKAIRARGNI